jgi:hypothetical protein
MDWTLPNKKTYAAAGLMVLVVAVEKLLGLDSPGIDVSEDWLKILIEALGLVGLRAAIAKQLLGGLIKK